MCHETTTGQELLTHDRIQVTTTSPDAKTYEGIVFTADATLGLLALNCAPAPPNPSTPLHSLPGDYHIIPIRHIASFKVLSAPEGAKDDYALRSLNLRALKDREEKAVREVKEQENKKGKDVSAEAQALFNKLDIM